MKKGFWSEFIMYVCIFILWLCLTLWADKVKNLVSIVLGCLALLYAIGGFISFFKMKERKTSDNLQLVYAITMLVIGGILIFKVDFLKELVSFIIGIYILLSSIIKLLDSLELGKTLNAKLTGPIVLSCVGLFIGIMCIAGRFLFPDIIITYVGILLLIYSIISIVNLIILRRK